MSCLLKLCFSNNAIIPGTKHYKSDSHYGKTLGLHTWATQPSRQSGQLGRQVANRDWNHVIIYRKHKYYLSATQHPHVLPQDTMLASP